MNPRTSLAIVVGATLGVLAALSVGPAEASTSSELRSIARSLERIATTLERCKACR